MSRPSLTLALLAGAALAGCGESGPQPPATVTVVTTAPQRAPASAQSAPAPAASVPATAAAPRTTTARSDPPAAAPRRAAPTPSEAPARSSASREEEAVRNHLKRDRPKIRKREQEIIAAIEAFERAHPRG